MDDIFVFSIILAALSVWFIVVLKVIRSAHKHKTITKYIDGITSFTPGNFVVLEHSRTDLHIIELSKTSNWAKLSMEKSSLQMDPNVLNSASLPYSRILDARVVKTERTIIEPLPTVPNMIVKNVKVHSHFAIKYLSEDNEEKSIMLEDIKFGKLFKCILEERIPVKTTIPTHTQL